MGQSSNGNYNSSYTGNEVDAAIGAVRNNKDSWNEAASVASAAQSTANQALAKANANAQAIANMGGGMSDEVYDAIKTNVNTLRTWGNSLLTALVNYAFNGSKPSAIAEFSWPENEGGSIPSVTPTLTIRVGITTVTNGSTISIGTVARGSNFTSRILVIRGTNLTQDISVSLTQGQGNSGTFTLSTNTVSASAANSSSGGNITITYTNTSDVDTTVTETAAISVASELGTMSFTVSGTKSADSTIMHTVRGTLSHCTISNAYSVASQVEDGGTWTGTLVADSGYDLPTIDSSIITSGSYGSVSWSGSTLTISNITSDITFSIVAIEAQQVTEYVSSGLILHLDGKNQGNTAGVWQDTASNYYNFTLVNNPSQHYSENEEVDGITFNVSGNDAEYGYCTRDINLAYNEGTIEVCFTPIGENYMTNEGSSHPFFASITQSSIAAYLQRAGVSTNLNGTFHFAVSNITSTSSEAIQARRELHSILTSATTISMNIDLFVVNGVANQNVLQTVSSGLLQPSTSGAKLQIGASKLTQTSTVLSANAIIHEIRVYNTKLSESQMRNNQKLDNERYNLGLTI